MMKRQRILIFCLLGLALVWRSAFVLALKWNNPSGDEAVAGLMAKHIAAGIDFPVFYYGQAYFGALESYLTAPLFLIAGFLPNLIYVWPVVFGALVVLMEYVLARDLAGETVALAGALIIAVAPAAYLYNTLNAGGGFGLALFLQLSALWLFVRIYTADEAKPGAWLGFCAVSGLLVWVWQLYIPLLPLLAGLLWLRRPLISRQSALLGVVFFLVCSGLFWTYNLTHDGASFAIGISKFGAAGGDTRLAPAVLLYNAIMNRIWNRATYLESFYSAIGGGNGLLFALIALGVMLLFIKRTSLTIGPRRLSPVMLVLLLAVLEFALSHRSERYLQIVPVLLLPCALVGLAAWSRRVLLPAACVVVVFSLYSLYPLFFTSPAPARPDWVQAINFLHSHQAEYGYTNYTDGYVITFLSGESIIASPLLRDLRGDDKRFDRYLPYTQRVSSAETAFVLIPDSADDRAALQRIIQQASPAPQPVAFPSLRSELYLGLPAGGPARTWIVAQPPQ